MIGEWNILQPSLKGLYHLEDANDSSGNGKNLTNSGPLAFSGGKFANCVVGNGTNVLTIADNMGVDGGVITLSFWVSVLVEPSEASKTLIAQANNTSKVLYYINYGHSGSTYSLAFHRSKVGVADQSFSATIPALGVSKWHHIAMTYDATNLTGYFDGGFAGNLAVSGNGTAPVSDGFTLLGGVDAAFNGKMDEAAIIGAALSYKQVNNYYAWSTGRTAKIL